MDEEIIISCDKSKLNIDIIYDFISSSYWGKERSLDEVKKSIDNSYCFGVYTGSKQIGFARITTDYTFFAYLADVFIVKEYRGLGLSKRLLEEIFSNSELCKVKKWMLATSDAHELYRKFGFTELSRPEKFMERC